MYFPASQTPTVDVPKVEGTEWCGVSAAEHDDAFAVSSGSCMCERSPLWLLPIQDPLRLVVVDQSLAQRTEGHTYSKWYSKRFAEKVLVGKLSRLSCRNWLVHATYIRDSFIPT